MITRIEWRVRRRTVLGWLVALPVHDPLLALVGGAPATTAFFSDGTGFSDAALRVDIGARQCDVRLGARAVRAMRLA